MPYAMNVRGVIIVIPSLSGRFMERQSGKNKSKMERHRDHSGVALALDVATLFPRVSALASVKRI